MQNAGHADFIELSDGSWAAVYLAARPGGSTPGYHVIGRESFLAGVDWVDGWPVIDETRFEIPVPDTAFHDAFAQQPLGVRWVVPNGEPDSIVEAHADGGISFRRQSPSSVLCARVQDLAWSARARLQNAGSLGVRLDDRHWAAVIVEDGWARAVARIGDLQQELGRVAVEATVTVAVDVGPPATTRPRPGLGGPDEIVFSVLTPAGTVDLGRLDGRYLSTEVASGFTGRMLTLGSPRPNGRVLFVEYGPRDS